MGGKLFNVARLPRERYLRLESQVRAYLDAKIPEAYRIPRFYANKPDFGDMDVLVSDAAGGSWSAVRDQLMADLGIERSKQNGPVFSAVYRDFQLDFIKCAPASLEITYHYMSFNDVGNLVGKIFRRLGLKYGNDGLSYVFRRRSNENYTHEIPVSDDIDAILALIGVDVSQWHRGFDELDQVFAWVIASPYFSVDPYLSPQRAMRSRLRKRPTVEKFVNYLRAHNVTKSYAYLGRDDYLPAIAERFPGADLLQKIDHQVALEERDNRITEKFNGKLVMQWFPELRGKGLGEFIVAFKKQFDDFDAAVSAMSAQDVERKARRFFVDGFK